jgi:hypothetical protein
VKGPYVASYCYVTRGPRRVFLFLFLLLCPLLRGTNMRTVRPITEKGMDREPSGTCGFGGRARGECGRAVLLAASVGEVLGGAARGECGRAVLLAASVRLALSPSASVVVLLKSDFLAYYC